MTHKQKFILSLMAILISIFVLLFLVAWVVQLEKQVIFQIAAAVAFFIFLAISSIWIYFSIKNYSKTHDMLRTSFNSYVEEVISNNDIGILTYDDNNQIIWVNSFVKNRFGENVINQKVNEFFKNTFGVQKYNSAKTNFKVDLETFSYEIQISPLKNTISIKDITFESDIIRESNEQKVVIGEIEIDNFQLYQSILSEEQIFNIKNAIVRNLEEYVKDSRCNIIYHQYSNGKFIIITNEKTLRILEEDDFSKFMTFGYTPKLGDTNRLSISVGFGRGWPSLDIKMEQAKKALLQAQNRGGDQVAIYSNVDVPKFYGSASEIIADNNRTNIKLVANNFEKKLKSSSISKVIIYGHKFADLDSIGASYALYRIVKNYNKNVFICNSTFDLTAEKVLQRYDLKNSFIKPLQAKKLTTPDTLVVFVDHSSPNRTDNPSALENVNPENIFIFDHHRVGTTLDHVMRKNSYIDPNASSACEIVTEMITFFKENNDIDTKTAQMLLNGIYLDTGQFTKSVTPRAFSAAAWLQTQGAKGTISTEILKIDEQTAKKVKELLSNIQEIKKGYYLAYSDIELDNDVISIAADEVLKISGRKASFVVAKKQGTNLYKLSARGINTNVQIICELVGGGGHFGTAAAETDEKLEIFIDNIKQAIVGGKHESNIN
ncbi:DHH family phosphoesterase [Mycoplasma sp. Ms02]|uniref:DHH family phosphoesterase n=1 Tax=Mycoplasma sp. Ms02 TaxID=353851 RepID=UPI001C8A728B|nr:DHH family phosphoesterase [Mycoplasma sp. Ms02]QZE12361.1 DHH family phosphoesterase [Mycoplasma sp. Ms02]